MRSRIGVIAFAMLVVNAGFIPGLAPAAETVAPQHSTLDRPVSNEQLKASKDGEKLARELVGQRYTTLVNNAIGLMKVEVANRPYFCVHGDCGVNIDRSAVLVEAIVWPEQFPGDTAKQYQDEVDACRRDAGYCYLRLKQDGGAVVYVRATTFVQASYPSGLPTHPGELYFVPERPSSAWKAKKKEFDRYWRKHGIQMGFTADQVLASNWGKPRRKVSSSTGGRLVELWDYGDAGSLMIENGLVVQIAN